ncbi:unnamed protein product [Parnassius mnemosyne]|uniref:Uncharacterized protein n=1 Tax=Parnassius mnemosyne TaxID=213953 RepID=A0AAV1KT16_9NEOP
MEVGTTLSLYLPLSSTSILYVGLEEMAKRGCREFHIQDEEILQLLMADKSDGEDDLQLDEEEQQFIAQDVENGTDVVEIEDSVQEPTN